MKIFGVAYKYFFGIAIFCPGFQLQAQYLHEEKGDEVVHYTGKTLSNIDYHDGQLRPAIGVHAQQVMRANREHPETADGFGWTYNHQPMLAYWNNIFWVEYLSDPVSEHEPPGHTLLIKSEDGQTWTRPEVLFPKYRIPNGFKKEGRPEVAKDLNAVMHQRVGFYVSKSKRLLAQGFYGIVMGAHDDPNDGKGIGRVVREIKKDGSFGPIYFIRYNKRWNKKNTSYPFYKESKDKGFVTDCEEILSNPLMTQQWVEEADRDDPIIPLKQQFKAFSYYHLPNGKIVGLWKSAVSSISPDGGKNWEYHPDRAPGFVNANAKIWGQRTSDGKFATVYNPSEFRWPLAVSTSTDGLDYTDLLLVHGEISPLRYGGAYKNNGPQYVRGILEGNGTPPDGKMWLTYSMNKEDIWVASVPVPIVSTVGKQVNEVFNGMPNGKELELWNTYDLKWASTGVEKAEDGKKYLTLKDKDAFDYATAERIIPFSKKLDVVLTVVPEQNKDGVLQIEFQNDKGLPAVRLIFDKDGILKTKVSYRINEITPYEAGEKYQIHLKLDAATRSYEMSINQGNEKKYIFYAPVHGFERIMFRTGEARHYPTPDTPAENLTDMEDTGKMIPETVFRIESLVTKTF